MKSGVRWFALVLIGASALGAQTAYFVFSGAGATTGLPEPSRVPVSFVVPVVAPAQIAQAREYLDRRERGLEPRPLIATLTLAVGGDGVNRNYAAPGSPLWNWRMTQVHRFERQLGDVFTTAITPSRDYGPAQMELLATNPLEGSELWWTPRPAVRPGDPPLPVPIFTSVQVEWIHYSLQMELLPGTPARFANISNRGFVGTGERVLITGFVVEGGAPRNVVIRALGPSLAAFGVAEPLADPMLEIFRGAVRLAVNDDWIHTGLNLRRAQTDLPPQPASPWAPTHPREPAMQLSLGPGNYTVVVRGAGTATGVALAEIYSIDPLR
jgi:hypothetical protein